MHRGMAAVVIVVAIAVTACSGGSKRKTTGGGATKPSTCALINELDEIAAQVAHADIADPDAFGKAFDAAVTKYVATVVQLKDVTPSSLHPDLDRLIAAVHQERFDDAADARASLDEYALSACGRALPTLPTVSSSSVPSTTTVPPT